MTMRTALWSALAILGGLGAVRVQLGYFFSVIKGGEIVQADMELETVKIYMTSEGHGWGSEGSAQP
jgi:hypothetical protein